MNDKSEIMSYSEMSRRKAEELKDRETVRILALETSCDETAAAVVENGRKILSNVVFSQIDLHELYGGVVPEIASRAHMEACDRVVDQALREAGLSLNEVDALAVTKGPGLVGALLTGVNCMKGLAFSNGGWLLNPQTDLLIRLMPVAFFVRLGIIGLLWALAVPALLAAGAGIALRRVSD